MGSVLYFIASLTGFVLLTPFLLRFAPASLRVWASVCSAIDLPSQASYYEAYADEIEIARTSARLSVNPGN